MSSNEPRIVEQDGNIVRIIAGPMEAIAAMHRVGDTLILDRAAWMAPVPVQWAPLRSFDWPAASLRIRGTIRTTGANPGKLPRQIVIHI
jgi:hypothetical protein